MVYYAAKTVELKSKAWTMITKLSRILSVVILVKVTSGFVLTLFVFAYSLLRETFCPRLMGA